jgi:DNA-binding LacI/PurR family transcriptional regulator
VSDVLAVGAVSYLHEVGLVVGQQVAVTGFDDMALAQFISPTLTTIRQPLELIGDKLAQMLITLIEGETLPESCVLLKPELIIRGST